MCIENFLSKTLPVPTGVPQGSILGPLSTHADSNNKTFNLICSDFGTLCCYANDSTCSFSSSSSSTDIISTKIGDDSRTLDTGQEIISTSRTEMLLGGLIYQNLKWTEHILLNEDSLIKKLGTRLNASR